MTEQMTVGLVPTYSPEKYATKARSLETGTTLVRKAEAVSAHVRQRPFVGHAGERAGSSIERRNNHESDLLCDPVVAVTSVAIHASESMVAID